MQNFFKFIKTHDMSVAANYKIAKDSMDFSEFINYLIVESFSNNIDWPINNIKLWRQQKVTKWRWMLYDLDFGFNGFGYNWNSLKNANQVKAAFDAETTYDWTSLVLKSLTANTGFKNDFVKQATLEHAKQDGITRAGEHFGAEQFNDQAPVFS